MSFKSLYVTFVYFLFYICLTEYNLEAQPQTETAEAYLSSGIEKMERGAFDEATADFDKALEIDPQLADAYYNRALAKQRLGKYQEAIDDYDKVIKIYPQHPKARHSLASLIEASKNNPNCPISLM